MGGARTGRADIAHDESLARVEGNRAGVVEWANEAFSRLTGIPVSETVNKPVSRLLERAGIELEVVEFVAEHFFSGRTCRIELPFEKPDGLFVDVLLEVDALYGGGGEIDRFVAVARERTVRPTTGDRARASDAPAILACDAASDSKARSVSTESVPTSEGELIELAPLVRRIADQAAGPLQNEAPRPLLDLALAPALDPIQGRSEDVEQLVASLLDAARRAITDSENAWGTLTVSTGRMAADRHFVSQAHAVPACPADRPQGSPIYLEIHDTGSPLPPDALEELAHGGRGTSPRERELACAHALARRIGATLHLDSTPGCGNQALVLFRQARTCESASAGRATLSR